MEIMELINNGTTEEIYQLRTSLGSKKLRWRREFWLRDSANAIPRWLRMLQKKAKALQK